MSLKFDVQFCINHLITIQIQIYYNINATVETFELVGFEANVTNHHTTYK